MRAWERRYGLLHPSRSAGGFRLYSSNDETIVRSMLADIERGYPPSQAAKLALARSRTHENRPGTQQPEDVAAGTTDPGRLDLLRTQLSEALRRYDGMRAQDLFDA
ncbi:MAG TPA: hypothetical protein VIJ96_07715, partial [Acidothermaceae bacterium]